MGSENGTPSSSTSLRASPRGGMDSTDLRRLGRALRAEERAAGRAVRPPKDLPPYLASLYEMPLLTREQEAHLFRKYNFLKYRAAKLREQLDPAQLAAALDAGAEFIVSPGLTDPLGKAAASADIPFLPGTSNTGDIMRALQARVGKLRDRAVAAITGRPAPGETETAGAGP